MVHPRRAEQAEPPSARPGVGPLVHRHTVEMVVGTALLAVIAVLTAGGDLWLLGALLCLAPLMAAAAVIDAHYRRIPAVLTRAAFAVGVAVFVTGAAVTGDAGRFLRVGAAAVAVGLLYLVLWRLGSMGLGDVRLAVTLGLVAGWAGWPVVVGFVVLAHLLAAPLAVWRLAHRNHAELPFGPALVAALYLTVAVCALAG